MIHRSCERIRCRVSVPPVRAFQSYSGARGQLPLHLCLAAATALLITLTSGASRAAGAAPDRSDGWKTATTAMAISAMGFELVMPRVFYSDPEVTVGWKARWHLSVLAPVMTLTTLSLLNEHYLKDSFKGHRPGCDDTNQGGPGCDSYGMLSTHSFAAFSALGQGAGVFFVDTLKWSKGNFNAGAFVGNVGVPLILGTLTAIGRTSGNWETGAQVWSSAGIGLVSGFGLGVLYALLQRPECGYTGNLVCW
jgi:hypothetical protein